MNKKYTCRKSAVITAKNNDLYRADSKKLFDFNLLDQLDVDDDIKQYIKKDVVKNTSLINNSFVHMYHETSDTSYFTAEIHMANYHVENEFHRLYTIYEVTEVKFTSFVIDRWYGDKKINREIKLSNELMNYENVETILIDEA